jgi:sugar lactone lactonase YvrE
MQPRVLLDGLAIPESPRWHEGRLWLSNWGTRQIVAVDLDGNSEVVGEGPDGLGWATNWLPDGGLLVTGQELIRAEPDGSRVRHADLSHISSFGWSEITVDGRGNVYVNTINFDFADFNDVLTSGEAPGKIALVTPDGEAREVANDCARIREGGEVLERIDLGRPCFAAMLGGPDRRTLFMLTAEPWFRRSPADSRRGASAPSLRRDRGQLVGTRSLARNARSVPAVCELEFRSKWAHEAGLLRWL